MSRIVRPTPESSEQRQWDCVHRCPQCGHITKLGDLDLKAATTGIAACPTCAWTGQIEIQVVERPQSVAKVVSKEESRGGSGGVELEAFTGDGIATDNGEG
jgi:transcription elongation factor Elf1